jgi:phenylacetate-coenzyme A ligase PaaK-like adenylate-forming protein
VNPQVFLEGINSANFEQQALATFARQYAGVPVYRQYADLLGKAQPKSLADIPFLPIDFFKSQQVTFPLKEVVKVFQSSGTTQQTRSQHFVTDLSWYDASLLLGFERVFGPASDYVFIALLPSYLENGSSSLIYMVDQLIQKSNSALSGYYLSQVEDVHAVYHQALTQGKEPFIFGVSYALLDLAESGVQLSKAKILETGGMKGRRQELTKIELHQILQEGFGVGQILSEYGMTELFSQAYCTSDQIFACPPWMQIRIRDAYDPFQEVVFGQKGGINIIDLANQNSCAFIQTDDLGRLVEGGFVLEGRLQAADIRGCNQLVDQ